jgi:hypothetical protein
VLDGAALAAAPEVTRRQIRQLAGQESMGGWDLRSTRDRVLGLF